MKRFRCTQCKIGKVKKLAKEPRAYFCSAWCAVRWSLAAVSGDRRNCPKCGSQLHSVCRSEYGYRAEEKCEECGHEW